MSVFWVIVVTVTGKTSSRTFKNMKYRLILITIFAALSLFGCITAPSLTRMDVDLSGVRYNPLAGQYFNYPLTAETDGDTLLIREQEHAYAVTAIRFNKKCIPGVVSAIDKYLEWEELATRRSEQFTKRIAGVDYQGGEWAFRFHSVGVGQHHLSIGARSKLLGDGVVAGVPDMSLDRANVLKLRKLIVDYRDGVMNTQNLDRIYK